MLDDLYRSGRVVFPTVLPNEQQVIKASLSVFVLMVPQLGPHCFQIHRLLDDKRIVYEFKFSAIYRFLERLTMLVTEEGVDDLVEDSFLVFSNAGTFFLNALHIL
jgi:hypothetical protein